MATIKRRRASAIYGDFVNDGDTSPDASPSLKYDCSNPASPHKGLSIVAQAWTLWTGDEKPRAGGGDDARPGAKSKAHATKNPRKKQRSREATTDEGFPVVGGSRGQAPTVQRQPSPGSSDGRPHSKGRSAEVPPGWTPVVSASRPRSGSSLSIKNKPKWSGGNDGKAFLGAGTYGHLHEDNPIVSPPPRELEYQEAPKSASSRGPKIIMQAMKSVGSRRSESRDRTPNWVDQPKAEEVTAVAMPKMFHGIPFDDLPIPPPPPDIEAPLPGHVTTVVNERAQRPSNNRSRSRSSRDPSSRGSRGSSSRGGSRSRSRSLRDIVPVDDEDEGQYVETYRKDVRQRRENRETQSRGRSGRRSGSRSGSRSREPPAAGIKSPGDERRVNKEKTGGGRRNDGRGRSIESLPKYYVDPDDGDGGDVDRGGFVLEEDIVLSNEKLRPGGNHQRDHQLTDMDIDGYQGWDILDMDQNEGRGDAYIHHQRREKSRESDRGGHGSRPRRSVTHGETQPERKREASSSRYRDQRTEQALDGRAPTMDKSAVITPAVRSGDRGVRRQEIRGNRSANERRRGESHGERRGSDNSRRKITGGGDGATKPETEASRRRERRASEDHQVGEQRVTKPSFARPQANAKGDREKHHHHHHQSLHGRVDPRSKSADQRPRQESRRKSDAMDVGKQRRPTRQQQSGEDVREGRRREHSVGSRRGRKSQSPSSVRRAGLQKVSTAVGGAGGRKKPIEVRNGAINGGDGEKNVEVTKSSTNQASSFLDAAGNRKKAERSRGRRKTSKDR